MTKEERYWSFVNKTDTCWLWTGYLAYDGYGRVTIDGKFWYSHRYGYLLAHGEVPPTLDHLCRVRNCVNPDHLEGVTNRENVLRGIGITAQLARRTICIHGHEFTPENTYVQPKTGRRSCRTCGRIKQRKRPPRVRNRSKHGKI